MNLVHCHAVLPSSVTNTVKHTFRIFTFLYLPFRGLCNVQYRSILALPKVSSADAASSLTGTFLCSDFLHSLVGVDHFSHLDEQGCKHLKILKRKLDILLINLIFYFSLKVTTSCGFLFSVILQNSQLASGSLIFM